MYVLKSKAKYLTEVLQFLDKPANTKIYTHETFLKHIL